MQNSKFKIEVAILLAVAGWAFGQEPDILDVQRMAIEYAEVSPEKIKGWRRSARLRALLPEVKFEVGRYVEEYWYEGEYRADKPKDRWSISLTWDLGDLLFSSAQTSIDERSKLMVELRNEILDDVNTLYFERKRLLAELLEEDSIEKRLKIEELTARLDGLTGGGFSKAIKP
jgi:hypothetical protein